MPLDQTKPIKKPKLNSIIGESGTSKYDGVITEEYNSELAGLQGIKIYDEMRKSDGTVRLVVQATSLPIRRARWFVKPPKDDESSEEVTEFVRQALFDWQSTTWDDFLRHALLMLPFGVMVFEKVFTLKDGKIVWNKFAPRLPKSIVRWETDDHQPGIVQQLVKGGQVSIPMDKLCVFVNEMEGENWWGNSILRSAYKHWFIKENLYKIDAIAAERQGLGVPFAKYEKGATQDDITKAEDTLRRMRAHEQAFMIVPMEWEIGFLDMGAKSTRDFTLSIAHHNREIAKCVMAQFLELGATEVGSRALSEDHSKLFMLSLEAVANMIKDYFNKYAIPQLVDFNFNVSEYPTLEYADIRDADAEKLATAYNTFVTAGAIIPTESDEQYIRELLHLPEVTEEDLQKREEEQAKEEALQAEEMKIQQARFTKAMSEYFQKKKITAAEFRPRRKLTFAEQKIDFSRIQNELDALESSFTDEAKRLLNTARDRYLEKLREAIKQQDKEAIKALELAFSREYSKLLKDFMKESFTYGKNAAAKEMDVQAPPNPQQMLAIIDTEADAIATKHAQQLTSSAKQGLLEAMKKQAELNALIGALHEKMTSEIARLTGETGSIVAGGYLNQGRNTVFDAYEDRIYALQRSEILDTVTCNYCLSVDGRIIEKTDTYAKNTIFHSHCRGIWVEILQAEEEKPKIEGIPQGLRDRFGDAVNALIQPKNPVTKKNSAAGKFVKRNK